ncbi:MAG: outer membrane protein assembly factor BamB family protein [Planctomycetota bacterium]|jgi:outer membrane protein assembly factor BamB
MKTASAALLLISLTTPLLTAQEDSWPGFRGPGRDGVALDAAPPVSWNDEENLTWRVELPGPGSSSPVILGEQVFISCYSGYGHYLDDGGAPKELKHHLLSFDRASGEKMWETVIPGPLPKEARKIQITEHGFASATPITDGERIYAFLGRAGVVATDLDGEILWQTKLGDPSPELPDATNGSLDPKGNSIDLNWGTASSPLLHGDLIIVNDSAWSHALQALNKHSGEFVWKQESANLIGCAASPMLVGPPGEEVMSITLAKSIWGMDPNTGEIIWQVPTTARGGMSPTSVSDGALLYAFGGSGEGHALHYERDLGETDESEENPRVVWKSANVGIPSPLLYQGQIYLVSSDGNGTCINAEDGEVIHRGRLEGRTGGVYASPVVANDQIYVVTRKRGTFVYSADGEFGLLARNELSDDSQFNGSPAIVGDQIFLRSDKFLYCISES